MYKRQLGTLWIEAGSNEKTKKDFFNCVGVPIVVGSNQTTTYIIDKFAIPTLHCVLGPCNRLYHILEDNCPSVEQFSKS